MAQVTLPTTAPSSPLHLPQARSPLFARLFSGAAPGKSLSENACVRLVSDSPDTLRCLLKVPVWGWLWFLAEVPLGDLLLISDYGKGVCTRGLLQMIGTRAREANILILIDPARSRNWSDYGQVSLIKANWAEATEAASCENPRPLALARELSDAHGCDVVVTLGRCGMVCAEQSGATWHLSATPTEVRDVCGAGDTVFAALSVKIVTGKSLLEACRAAMRAAGRQVGAVGIAAVRSHVFQSSSFLFEN